jgi:hypothetical protein
MTDALAEQLIRSMAGIGNQLVEIKTESKRIAAALEAIQKLLSQQQSPPLP